MNKLPQPSSFSVNRTSATILSLTTSSRIPLHINGSVVPAAASRSPANTVNDIATLISTLISDMSISKLNAVKPTFTSPSISNMSKSPLTITATTSASKECPPLRQHQQRSLANITPSVNFASISDRIAERRRRVIANLAHGPKRPTPLVKVAQPSTLKSSTTSFSILPLTPITDTTTTASISQSPSISSAIASAVPIIPTAIPVVEIPATMSEPIITTVAPKPTITAVVPEPVVAAGPTPRRYGYVVVHMPANYCQQEHEGKSHHIERFVEISDRVWNSTSLIPSASTGRKPRTQLPGSFRLITYPLTRTPIPDKLSPVFLPHTTSQLPKHFSQVYLTLRVKPDKTRGKSPYCPGRPWFPGGRPALGYGPLRNGRNCGCCSHYGETPLRKYHTRPNKWATTPAESGVDPNPPLKKPTTRPRKVRFAENLTHTFDKVKPSNAIIKAVYETEDMTTRAQDFPDGFPLCDE